ncbi:Na+/H+ antiporter [Heterostelium album PN500]|uniref:Na+/H+ antiporter n=1 Tax=Heterostelium pallidum (strain ATCC 26659 / Pp 5 / PN500) TaxID=670386 RepID=D3BMQ3_HETP5|nr:Na+/H+ antiporter [Heterostelium album PN500]EFA77265.1 Na+/H+ antiporter [Heterostelium album PN500]|eukprot:XP_020429394.1 Na+/H+ antiporter [Heterostelium album PN500]
MAAGASSIVNGLNPVNDPLALFIIQLLLIVIISRLLGYILSYIYQPPVISEVITGIILGPSVLGWSDAFEKNVFSPGSVAILNVIANVGLILFMFMIGLEVDAKLLKNNVKMSVIISFSSIILPFAMGIGLAAVLWNVLVEDTTISFALFAVFVGVAISITAFPVLARILTERGLMSTKVGSTSLAAASVDDVIAWILLAFVVSFAKNIGTGNDGVAFKYAALWTFLLLIGFLVLMFTVVRIGLNWTYQRLVRTEAHKHNYIVFLLMFMFISAFYTEVIGVHAIFGAFVVGVMTPRTNGLHLTIVERIQDIVTIILLPLYFTNSGLKTQLSSINSGAAGGCTILIIVVACVGKIGGATLAARYCKNSWRESITVGFLMNTKGLVELIVLNIGLEIKVLDSQMFTMFVVMALVTTFMTTPFVHLFYINHIEKKSRQPMIPRATGKFDILLYPSQILSASSLVMVAGSIISATSGNKKYKVRSIYAVEASGDRPSTIFGNNVNNLPQNKRELYEVINRESTLASLTVKPLIINSTADISNDICTVARRQWPDLVLMSVGNNNEHISGDNVGVDSLLYGRTIQKVLQNVKSAVGIVVDKGIDKFNKSHTILVMYTGEDYESDAITLVMKMARRKNYTVHVVTNKVDKVRQLVSSNDKLDVGRFVFIENSSPYQEVLQRSRNEDHDYWMVVAGLPREEVTIPEKLMQTSIYTLFFVHPSNTLLDSHTSLQKSSSTLHLPDANHYNETKDTIELNSYEHGAI